MRGAARGINDRKIKDRLFAAICFCIVQHGIKSAVEQRLNQTVWRVVAPRRFANIPSRLVASCESEIPTMVGACRNKFQQPLIDRSEFLGGHVAPVDAHPRLVVVNKGQAVDRVQEMFVGNPSFVQVRRQALIKETAEGGQAEFGLAMAKRAESDARAFPGIPMRVS